MAVHLISIMEKILAADQVVAYDERGADCPLSDEEIDMILRALVDCIWPNCCCAEAEVEQLEKDFLYYATHRPDCAGGDGIKCACGYLDTYARIND